MRAVVTGGGTGGHIYPALAVASALKKEDPNCEVRYIGGLQGMEAKILPGTAIPYHLVTSRKLRKVLSVGTIGVLFALAKGYREAAAYLKEFAPEVVISTGGYTAAATALAAANLKIPTIVQEYNAIPGRTNQWISKRATKVCVWFDETADQFAKAVTVKTGVPLREGLISQSNVEDARVALGLDRDLFTVLVLGGSQGSKRINELTLEMVRSLDRQVQILHQTGEKNIEGALAMAAKQLSKQAKYHPKAFLSTDEIPLAYKAADVLICRCGISTLAEACVNGVPMLMIPLPTAYADHQTANAKIIVNHAGGVHLPEALLSADALVQTVDSLMGDPEQLRRMSEGASRLAKPNAAQDVARLAIGLDSGGK